jgi:formylmethanofuran dehydrogenase subunit E
MSVQTNSREVTIQCDACGTDFTCDKWSANNGLTLCSDCTYDMSEAEDVFESALWAKAGRNER